MISGYLTLRANGAYLLTRRKPVICRIAGVGHEDAFPKPGDTFSYNNICAWTVKRLFGDLETKPLEPLRVWLKAGVKQK